MNKSNKHLALSVLTCFILSGCVIEKNPASSVDNPGDNITNPGDNSGGDNENNYSKVESADINLFSLADLKGTLVNKNTNASIKSTAIELTKFDNSKVTIDDIEHWKYESNIATWVQNVTTGADVAHTAFGTACPNRTEGEKVDDADKVSCVFLSRPRATTGDGNPVKSRMIQKDVYGLVGGVEYAVEYTAYSAEKKGTVGVQIELVDSNNVVIETLPFEYKLSDAISSTGWIYPQFRFTIPEEYYANDKDWVKTNIAITAEGVEGLYRIAKLRLTVPAAKTTAPGVISNDTRVSVSIDGDDPLDTITNETNFTNLNPTFISDANNKFKYAWIESLDYQDGKLVYTAPDKYKDDIEAYYNKLETDGITGITYFDFPLVADPKTTFATNLFELEDGNKIFEAKNYRWVAAAAYHFAKNNADIYPVVGALNHSLRRLKDAGLTEASNTGKEYLDLLKAVSMGLKAASPEIKVSAFSFAGDTHLKFANARELKLVGNSIKLGSDFYYDLINQNRRPLNTNGTADAQNKYALYSTGKMPMKAHVLNTKPLRDTLVASCANDDTSCKSQMNDMPVWVTGVGVPTKLDSDTVFDGETSFANAIVLNDGTRIALNSPASLDDGTKLLAAQEGKTFYQGNGSAEYEFVSNTNGALQLVAETSASFTGGAEKVFVRTIDNIDSGAEGVGNGVDLYSLKSKTFTVVNEMKKLLAGAIPQEGDADLVKNKKDMILDIAPYSPTDPKTDATHFQWSRFSKGNDNYFVVSISRVTGKANVTSNKLGYFAQGIIGLDGEKSATIYQFDPSDRNGDGVWNETSVDNLQNVVITVDTPVIVVQEK